MNGRAAFVAYIQGLDGIYGVLLSTTVQPEGMPLAPVGQSFVISDLLNVPVEAIGLVMGIGSYFIRQVSPQDHWTWPFGIIPMPLEPAHYLQYVMMFILGVLAGRCGWLEKMSHRVGASALAIGLLFALGNYVRGDGN